MMMMMMMINEHT